MKTLIFLLFVNFPIGILEDRNQDGVIDYVNARVYVADDPTPEELAAAGNIAARMAFESLSIDLPIGYAISDYSNGDSSVAIVVGSAATRFLDGQSEAVVETTDGDRRVIAVATPEDANAWARSLESPQPPEDASEEEEGPEGEEAEDENEEDTSEKPIDEKLSAKTYSLARLYTPDGLLGDSNDDFIPDKTETTIFIGPDTQSRSVIDLAARIGLETTGLRLPLVLVADEEQEPQNPILIGESNPHVQELIEDGKFSAYLAPGQGRIEVVRKALEKDHTALVIVGGTEPEKIVRSSTPPSVCPSPGTTARTASTSRRCRTICVDSSRCVHRKGRRLQHCTRPGAWRGNLMALTWSPPK